MVYRLEKVKKITGLDLREFEDAILFKVAVMVKQYLDSQNTAMSSSSASMGFFLNASDRNISHSVIGS